ncbi:hypothetical protein B0T13DRAFT_453129 [Neurospora crassa]|nr:hypothetical protein B0T13DRAFT_453129 [Neurospora crassa]
MLPVRHSSRGARLSMLINSTFALGLFGGSFLLASLWHCGKPAKHHDAVQARSSVALTRAHQCDRWEERGS